MGRVLVTGGAGFIGSRLTAAISRDRSARVAVVDNLSRSRFGPPDEPANNVDFYVGDIRDYHSVRKAAEGCEVIFHLAAQANVIQSEEDLEYCCRTNVRGTRHVLQAAIAAGVRRVVFTSSREVYGDPSVLPVREDAPLSPKNAYGASKAAAEMYCRAWRTYGLQTVIVRLTNVYGPGDRDRVVPLFAEAALRGEPLVVYGGGQVLDFVWIDDVVDGLLRAGFGEYHAQPVNIGSGVGTTILDLARRVLRASGSTSSIRRDAPRDCEVEGFVADVQAGRDLLGLKERRDPLWRLPDVIDAVRAAMDAQCCVQYGAPDF